MRLFATLLFCLLISACSAQQEDALLQSLNDFAVSQAGLEVKQAKVDELDIAYLENQQQKPVLVLLHGFSAQKESWLQFAGQLSEDFHLIIPDQAGHGASSKELSTDYDLIKQAQRLHALMQQKGIRRFHILGNSMGGAVAAIYASRYPDQISSLTLMNAAGAPDAKPSEYFAYLAKGENPLISTDAASFDFKLGFVATEAPYIPGPLKNAIVRQTVANENVYRKVFADMMATRAKLEAQGFEQQLQNLRMPTLILWGKQDRVLDVSGAQGYKKYLPQAKVIIYPEVGHIPMIEIPKQSALDVAAFLQALPQS